jgi:hypothetical protein
METIDVRETARRLGLGLKAVRDLSDHGVLTNVQPVTPGAQKHYRHFAVREVSALKKVYVKRAGVKYLKMRMREQLAPGAPANGTNGHGPSHSPSAALGTPAPTSAVVPASPLQVMETFRKATEAAAPAPGSAPSPMGIMRRLEALEFTLGALEETISSQTLQLHDLQLAITSLLKVWA